MSTVANPTLELPAVPPASAAIPMSPSEPVKVHVPIMIDGDVLIPGWVVDQESFRRWAHSEEFPQTGRYSFIDGMLWVDRSMEQLFSHNQVKGEYSTILKMLTKASKLGYFFFDKTLLSHAGAGLSTEPDGLFFAFDALRVGRIRLIEGTTEGYVELEGTPDMTLEVVSKSSVKKDTEVLKEKYAKAGVPILARRCPRPGARVSDLATA